jgi:hypothetical protein
VLKKYARNIQQLGILTLLHHGDSLQEKRVKINYRILWYGGLTSKTFLKQSSPSQDQQLGEVVLLLYA